MRVTWCIATILFGVLPTAIWAQTRVDPFRSATRPADSPKSSGVIASVEFVDAPVNTVFKMISDLTGWSIILSPEVTKQPPRINIWIKNLTPNEVLDQVCTMGNLTLERKGNTIQVLTFDEYAQLTGLEKRVITLKFASARDVAALARPFCDKSEQARLVADESAGRIILLMPRQRLESLEKLISTLDTPFEPETVRVYRLKHLDGAKIVPTLDQFLSRSAAPPSPTRRTATTQESDAPSVGERWNVQFMFEPMLNVIVLRGAPAAVTRAAELVTQLDQPPDLKVNSYELKYTNARDIYTMLNDVLRRSDGRSSESRIRLALNESSNRILVEAPSDDHLRVASILEAADKPMPPGTGGSRVYRLENASSTEVATVLDGLLNDTSVGSSSYGRSAQYQGSSYRQTPQVRVPTQIAPVRPTPAPTPSSGAPPSPSPGPDAPAVEMVPPRVIDAPEINAVIVRASAAEQEEVASIVKELDRPRSQVVLEVTLVTVRSDNTFDLGLELQGGHLGGSGPQALGFSTFGVGDASGKDGTLRLTDPPKFGASIAVFDSSDYSLVLNALKTVGEVRISSAPKILAQDNSKAQISSINQEPYETFSQGQTSTLASFGGFVDAGTKLTVIPHISRQSWLRLDYEIDQSSFGTRTAAQTAANLPPPRRQAFVTGTARIPSEHMVVLGGVVDTRKDDNVSSVPLLGDIPLLGELFKTRSNTTMNETLFVFIRPRVLRDPLFKDLLHLSRADLDRAKVPNRDLPRNEMKAVFGSLADPASLTPSDRLTGEGVTVPSRPASLPVDQEGR